jgi:hypothetical protein
MTVLLVLSLLADPTQELQGTWTSAAGTVVVIEDDQVWVGKGEEAEFKGLVGIPKKGVLQIIVGGEVAIEMSYIIDGDSLTLTIDGNPVKYKRKPVKGRG